MATPGTIPMQGIAKRGRVKENQSHRSSEIIQAATAGNEKILLLTDWTCLHSIRENVPLQDKGGHLDPPMSFYLKSSTDYCGVVKGVRNWRRFGKLQQQNAIQTYKTVAFHRKLEFLQNLVTLVQTQNEHREKIVKNYQTAQISITPQNASNTSSSGTSAPAIIEASPLDLAQSENVTREQVAALGDKVITDDEDSADISDDEGFIELDTNERTGLGAALGDEVITEDEDSADISDDEGFIELDTNERTGSGRSGNFLSDDAREENSIRELSSFFFNTTNVTAIDENELHLIPANSENRQSSNSKANTTRKNEQFWGGTFLKQSVRDDVADAMEKERKKRPKEPHPGRTEVFNKYKQVLKVMSELIQLAPKEENGDVKELFDTVLIHTQEVEWTRTAGGKSKETISTEEKDVRVVIMAKSEQCFKRVMNQLKSNNKSGKERIKLIPTGAEKNEIKWSDVLQEHFSSIETIRKRAW